MSQTIGFLGPEGTFSEIAAHKAIQVSGKNLQPVSILGSNLDVIESLSHQDVDFIVISISTVNGPINEHLEKLNQIGAKQIIAPIEVPVSFHLMGLAPTINTTDIVYVQEPQAFNQCSNWFAGPKGNRFAFSFVKSNAEAAMKASQNSFTCCISSELCSEIYGLNIYERNVEDNKGSITTFGVYSIK